MTEENVKKIGFFRRIYLAIKEFEHYGIFAAESIGTAIKYLLGIILISLLLVGCRTDDGVDVYQSEATENESDLLKDKKEKTVSDSAVSETEHVVVFVCGAVLNPGLYELESGSRAGHAVSMAGGMIEGAVTDGINLADIVTDGDQIRVPFENEIIMPSVSGSSDNGKVNLNTATAEQLMTLPGIGQSKADCIIKYREEHGSFSSEDEIMKIEGIKKGVYNKIKELICVR